MITLRLGQRPLYITDTHISGNCWWASKYALSTLPEYQGKWCLTVALPKSDTCPGINFPCVIDDFGTLVRV